MEALARWGAVAILAVAACGGRVSGKRSGPSTDTGTAGTAGTPAALPASSGGGTAGSTGNALVAGSPASMAGTSGSGTGQAGLVACDPPCRSDQYCKGTTGVCWCTDSLQEEECDGACVPVFSNPDHCGACGAACHEQTVCAWSTCTSLAGLPGDYDYSLAYSIQAEWTPSAGSSVSDPTDEDFVPVHSHGKVIVLTFKDEGATVEIPEFDGFVDGAVGTLSDQTDTHRLYALDDGWAGGILELWIEDRQIAVKLEAFGSGVPTTYASRGISSIFY